MEKLILVKTLSQLKELESYLVDKEIIAYDTETNGVVKESVIIGFSVAAELDQAYYVVLSYWDTEKQSLIDLETKAGAAAFIKTLKGKKLVMHNAVFDCWMTDNNFRVSLIDDVHTDTMLLAHLIDENRSCGLKELGVFLFGDDAKKEQEACHASVYKNGGLLTKDKYELYKADPDPLGLYGAKDTILTLKVFYELLPQLFEQGLDKFFYDDETMPLLKGPTYDMNTTGLAIDPKRLQTLKMTLQTECLEAKGFIYKEIEPHIKAKYKGTSKSNTFNIGASQQLSWLLHSQLGERFHMLTDSGKELCKSLGLRTPYTNKDQRAFIETCTQFKGRVWAEAAYNYKTKKMGKPKKIGDPWTYMSAGKATFGRLAQKYKWVATLIQYNKNLKLLNTYVEGIEKRMAYNVIRPNFLQHGTTSGRYSCKAPNFQNLPRDDKRVKSCIIARPGKVFVGADYSQLEPRVFASFSGDERLQASFASGDDFYSVVGVDVFGKYDCSLKKKDPNSFAVRYEKLRDVTKVVALSTVYGKTAAAMAVDLIEKAGVEKTREEAQEIIDDYLGKFPKVLDLMLKAHEEVKKNGVVYNLFGRPRRIPLALKMPAHLKKQSHAELPYEWRTVLNLAINHTIQSTGASIMNRGAILAHNMIKNAAIKDARWKDVKIVMQVHDELILEGPEALGEPMRDLLKYAMENAVTLPGVALQAEPKIAKDIAALK